jgi:hypothetical protein
MANGVTIPDVSVQPIPARMLGLRSLIWSFFESTEAQPEYKNNCAWNEPINQDAKGLFCLYYQNVHGIPRDDVNLSKIYRLLLNTMSVVFVCQKLTLTGTDPTSGLNIYQDNETWKYSATSFSLIDMESSLDYITGGTLTSTVD